MAHYALLDENNIVVQVITGRDENEDTNWEIYYGNITGKTCKRTSYNSCAGNHPEGAHCCFRKNYAGIGYSYNQEKDAFIPPKPYNSWVINDDSCCWKAPIEQPEPVSGVLYIWDENIVNWKETELS
jgi:hypothetical protein